MTAGSHDAAISIRFRGLHCGRSWISNAEKAMPMITASAKAMKSIDQFMARGLVGNCRCGNPLGSGWKSAFSTA